MAGRRTERRRGEKEKKKKKAKRFKMRFWERVKMEVGVREVGGMGRVVGGREHTVNWRRRQDFPTPVSPMMMYLKRNA